LLLVPVVVLVACGGGRAVSATTGPPVIHETFTVLPCPQRPVTTIDLQGCAERALLESNRKINARVDRIFRFLRSKGPRAAFVRGGKSWLNYRRTSCSAEASRFAGGSLRPVAFAHCEVGRNKTHLIDLAQMQLTLRQG
jgi:uncharacterized protein YecT (DUF1311 family)